ncbi:lytic transglycosylase domain-containing protein [Candidatus Binatia bacterium]|nr:lytic transglycosylase domain-containing protein [Candidatus Binatia bacterium]
MKEALLPEGLAAPSAADTADALASARAALRGMSRRARRAVVAATLGGSLAVLLSPVLISKQGSTLPKAKPAKPLPAPQAAAAAPVERPDVVDQILESAETRAKLFTAISQCRPSLGERQRWRIVDAIREEAERHGYDPLFVMAIIEVESTCSPTANSPRGAVGLTQIKPSTAREVAKDLGLPWGGANALVQPNLNIRLGLGYLAQLEEKFGDPYVAMAAYNLGPEKASRMSRQHAKRARYVKKVLARYEGLLVEHAA